MLKLIMENKLPDSEVNFLTAKAELFAFKTFGLASNCTIVTTESLPDQLRTSPDTLDSSKIMGMVQLPMPASTVTISWLMLNINCWSPIWLTVLARLSTSPPWKGIRFMRGRVDARLIGVTLGQGLGVGEGRVADFLRGLKI